MTDDLKQRLLTADCVAYGSYGDGTFAEEDNALPIAAAHRIAHLEAQVARLTKERDEAYERAAMRCAWTGTDASDEFERGAYAACIANQLAIRNLKEQP